MVYLQTEIKKEKKSIRKLTPCDAVSPSGSTQSRGSHRRGASPRQLTRSPTTENGKNLKVDYSIAQLNCTGCNSTEI